MSEKFSGGRLAACTILALFAFAGNSLLCRAALRSASIDAATFTAVRILAGAAILFFLIRLRRPESSSAQGNWLSAGALFIYAAAFSFAYLSLSAGTGALLLFGAVQATMIGWGWKQGERFSALQILGAVLALAGLVLLFLPSLSTPPLAGSLLMISAGIAWGVYSLRGKDSSDPALVTTGNFLRAAPMATILALVLLRRAHLDATGVFLAVISGAITSGLGYIVWYAVLPSLPSTSAAMVQLSVPVISAAGGILFLHEHVTARYLLASVAVLGGIAIFLRRARPKPNET